MVDEVKKEKKRGPKPRVVVDEEMLLKVEQLAGQGLTQEEIANYFGLKRGGWYKTINNNPIIRQHVERGRVKTLAAVSGKLMELVKKGNLSAIIFFLKTKGRWSEHKSLEITDGSKPENIKLKLDTKNPIEASKVYQQIMTTGS